ncbi:MAG TPA: DNA gyrase modulator, partial [Jatrophihabitans sp.]|nr:DNA gyrase modulator [Jatrophihabitans sp.]
MPRLDEDFLALPADYLADAALSRADAQGVEHADFRLERIRKASITLRDGQLESSADDQVFGLSVRVLHDGAWGFASGVDRTAQAAARLAEQAVATARVSRVLSTEPVQLADEPVHSGASWISDYQINPFEIPAEQRMARLLELSERLLSADGVDHVNASLVQVQENKYYADSAGTRTVQQRVRIQPELTAVQVDLAGGRFSAMRTLA